MLVGLSRAIENAREVIFRRSQFSFPLEFTNRIYLSIIFIYLLIEL